MEYTFSFLVGGARRGEAVIVPSIAKQLIVPNHGTDKGLTYTADRDAMPPAHKLEHAGLYRRADVEMFTKDKKRVYVFIISPLPTDDCEGSELLAKICGEVTYVELLDIYNNPDVLVCETDPISNSIN